MSDIVESSRSRELVPNFYYDVISFILPGAYLAIGWIWIQRIGMWGQGIGEAVKAGALPLQAISGSMAAVLLGIVFFFFIGSVSLIGYLLSAVSQPVAERLFWRGKKHKLNMKGLKGHLGSSDTTLLETSFRKHFGFLLRDETLNRASFLCFYFVWVHVPRLGMMLTRHDAEAASTRSLLLGSLLLFFDGWLHAVPWRTECLFLLIGVSSWFAYNYHREKRVYSRFAAYLAVISELTTSAEKAHERSRLAD